MSATTRPKPDRVDRALAAARRAVGKLVELLDDEDGAIVAKAAGALEEVGPFAVGPLAAALPRARSVRLRLMIIGGLPHFAPQARGAVGRALTGVLEREKNPLVLMAARDAFARVVVDDVVESATRSRDVPAGPRPADARPDDRGTLLSLQEVYRALEGCEARFKLLLSDACRNDPIAAVSRRATVNLESVTRPQVQKPPGGVAALFSCSEGELAFENDTLKHGVFFHFVIEGLRGEADLDKDRQVGLEELAFFAKRRVLDFVRAEYDGVRQMPVLKGEIGGLPVLISLDRTRVPVIPIPRPSPPGQPSEWISKSTGMKLILIKAGEFDMGSPDWDKDARDDEKPRHRVRITRPFYGAIARSLTP